MSLVLKKLAKPLVLAIQRARKLASRLLGSDRVLEWRAVYVRWRSPGTFIAVTGSSGKTVTSALISYILSGRTTVQSQVMRNWSGSHVKRLQAKLDREGFYVGEIGASGPGTLDEAIRFIRPSVGVITLVALEHKSAFRTIEAVAEEKGKLVEALPADGLAVLNQDDPRVAAMAQRTKARVVTFGQSGGDYLVSQVVCRAPEELSLRVTHQGQAFDLTTRLTGTHQSLAVAAAFACAHQLGLPPPMILERIASFEQVFGRCSVHRVENGPVFIVDTVKAPYHSIYLAIDMLAGFDAPRKRIVIGQISDTAGGSSDNVYRRIYKAARAIAHQVIFVGEHAHRAKATSEEVADGRFVRFYQVRDAAAFLQETGIPDEIILLKSAASLHLERLLLTQIDTVRCWQQDCGLRGTCVRSDGGGCGLYAVPFEQHKPRKGRERHVSPATART